MDSWFARNHSMGNLTDKYCIVGIGQTAFMTNSGRSTLSLVCEAMKKAMNDAGLSASDIDGITSFGHGDCAGAAAVATAMGLRPNYYMDVDGGGSSTEALITHAIGLLEAGACKCIAIYRGQNGRSGRRMGQQPGDRPDSQFRQHWGWTAPVQWFAMPAMRYLRDTGTSTRAFADIAVTHRYHASLNPKAMSRDPITVEDHQNSRWIAKPFRLLDCCRESDNAGVLIITSRERAFDLKQPPVFIMSAVARTTTPNPAWTFSNPVLHRAGGHYSKQRLFGQAGVSPKDLDFVSLYDAFTYECLLQYETWGFCGYGEAGEFVKDGRTRLDGVLPTNTGGGLLSEGYVHGLNLVLENVRQLRHRADDACPRAHEGIHTYDRSKGCRQVKRANLAASLASIEENSSGVILRST